MYIHIHTYIRTYIHNLHTYIIYIHTADIQVQHTNAYKYMLTYIYIYIHTHSHINICMHACRYAPRVNTDTRTGCIYMHVS